MQLLLRKGAPHPYEGRSHADNKNSAAAAPGSACGAVRTGRLKAAVLLLPGEAPGPLSRGRHDGLGAQFIPEARPALYQRLPSHSQSSTLRPHGALGVFSAWLLGAFGPRGRR